MVTAVAEQAAWLAREVRSVQPQVRPRVPEPEVSPARQAEER